MTPTSVALGLTLCDYLLIEETTRKASLIGCFSALSAAAFPSSPYIFFVFAELTDGAGQGLAELIIARLDTEEVIRRQARVIDFQDRFFVVRYGMHVTDCVFPTPGKYLVALNVDHELVAQRELNLRPRRGSS
jgi:Family of unknown function (DUF6941)